MTDLLQRFRGREAYVGVVGLGYVGLPLAVELAEGGYRVVGIDINPSRVESINAGISHIPDIQSERLRALVKGGRLRATTTYESVGDLDAISICVPTPLKKTKDPDIGHVVDAVESMVPYLSPHTVVVLESTTYPGTTEELVAPALAGDRFEVGVDLFVAFSPERLDPANKRFDTRNTPKVIGGMTPACTEHAVAYYGAAIETPYPVGSARTAEMVKLLENTFRAVNIALVNELLVMSERMGVDIWEVIDAASTKPYGFMPFYPGPGIGGHCIPIDPTYLSWKAKTFGFYNRFIELATDINGNMPRYVTERVMRLLNEHGRCAKGSQILVIGVAYKGGVNDTREAPGIELLGLLQDLGAEVAFHDPMVEEIDLRGNALASMPLTEEVLGAADLVVVATETTDTDWALVAEAASLVLDTRNALRGHSSTHIVCL